MRFDIVTGNASYRGIGRALGTSDFYTLKTKVRYNELLTCYFKYLDLMYNPCSVLSYDESLFEQLKEYYFVFKNYGVSCEMIAYNDSPIENVFGNKIQLLGIDVVHDMAESLLESPDTIGRNEKIHLNAFGLLQNIDDMNTVFENSVCGDNEWKPCWVYKVMI